MSDDCVCSIVLMAIRGTPAYVEFAFARHNAVVVLVNIIYIERIMDRERRTEVYFRPYIVP